jgi:hypothetical protein
MAKKQDETGAPKVTSLPLPISDTPLVIDLPDGQKIVIGKMQPGSVIEVATWRGTGRPDSRTNRLMMGMNNGAPTPATVEVEKTSDAQISKPADLKSKAISLAKGFLVQTQKQLNSLQSLIKNRRPIATKIHSANQESSASLASASEVDQWLQKVLERSEKKAAKSTQSSANQAKKSTATKKKTPAKKTKK